MSEIRVDKIQAYQDSFSVTIAGITTFSGTGCVSMPGGTSTQRPEVSKKGQIRYINGDVKKGLEFYNGTEWVTVGVANGSVPEGTTPIGVFGGGRGSNVIDYITISSLSNATDFGDLVASREGFALASTTRGVFSGSITYNNSIDYITISSTGNASTFGQLTVARRSGGACSNSTRGLFAGGWIPSGPTYIGTNVIDYITIATTGNAQNFGALLNLGGENAGCSSSTRGIFGGGYNITSFIELNIIEYVTISTLATAQDFADLTVARQAITACSSSTRGVFGGGLDKVGISFNTIDYITIASAGTNASTFGTLTTSTSYLASCSSSTRGVFGGGYIYSPATSQLNTIEYITIATTSSATDFGDLTVARGVISACSNSHGGLLTS
jgi:hypothetical protein